MSEIDYSVIIRTIGKANEKYKKLLNSIKNARIKPKDVIVVLPKGYSAPKEQLGIEQYYYCDRGMVNQRLVGINKCKTKYALILDDDIEFDSDFISKVSRPVISGEHAISAGPLLSFFPQKGFQSVVCFLCGSASPTIFHKNRYNTVLKTTGYSYNRNIKIGEDKLYETQTAAWTCFFADIEKLRSIHFEDELWLDKNGYSAHDDTAMFYKAWINGLSPVIVADAIYIHLDAGTSRIKNSRDVVYSMSFNTYVFWKRFLFDNATMPQKVWCRICFCYYNFTFTIMSIINLALKKTSKDDYSIYKKGKKDAKKWIKTDEYKKLPRVRRV